MRQLLLVALSFAVSGCMLSPVDGTSVTSTTGSISFGGYTNTASQSVVLEYGTGSTWTSVDTTTTSPTVSYTTNDGVDLYGWSLPRVLPAAAWTPGTTGSFAKVRMRVPGAGTGGADAYMTTFLSNWSTCYEQNPALGNFLSRCKSPRSPQAFLYTRDFPAGVDLVVTTLLWTSSGRTEVRVKNNGRPGVLGSVECWRSGSASVFYVNEPILPGETKIITSAVAPIGTVTCAAIGTNENGSAEANTSNNTLSRFF